MSTKKYQKELQKVIDSISDETLKNLLTIYKKSYNDSVNTLAKYYRRFAKDGKLTDEILQNVGQKVNLMKEIENHILNIIPAKDKLIVQNSFKVYEESFYKNAYSIDATFKKFIGFGKVNDNLMQASVNNTLSKITLPEVLNKSKLKFINDIKIEIGRGLLNGDPYDKMSKRVAKIYNQDYNRADLIVKTEAHRNQMTAQNQSYDDAKRLGVSMTYIWISSTDRRTRPDHIFLDGQERTDAENFQVNGYMAKYPGGFGVASEDIRCRCGWNNVIKNFKPRNRYLKEFADDTDFKKWKKQVIRKKNITKSGIIKEVDANK